MNAITLPIRETPKRGSVCGLCGVPATVLMYRATLCTVCADESDACSLRWNQEKVAAAEVLS